MITTLLVEKMAPSNEQSKDDVPGKFAFSCCRKKFSGVIVCVKCGGLYHYSCATRDWSGKVVFIDKTRVICCDVPDKSEVGGVAADEKTDLIECLKRLVEELTDKNRILQENSDLWKQKFADATKPQKNSRQEKGKQKQQQSAVDNDDIVDVDVHEHEPSVPNQTVGMGLIETPSSEIKMSSDSELGQPVIVSETGAHENKEEKRDWHDPNPAFAESKQKQRKNSKNTKDTNTDLQQRKITVPVVTLGQVNKAVDAALNQKNNKDAKEEASWTKVARKSKPKPSSERPAPLKGSNDNKGNLKTATKRAVLFVSGLAPDTAQSDVLEYLKHNGMGDDCTCEKMQTKKDKHKASFRLIVPHSAINQYLCTTLWPRNVIVNHFMNIQRH